MAIFHCDRTQKQRQRQQLSMAPRGLIISTIMVVLLLLASNVPMVHAGQDKDAERTPAPTTIITDAQSPSPRPKETPKPSMPPMLPMMPPIMEPTAQPIAEPAEPASPPPPPGPSTPTTTVAVALPQMRFVLEATGPLEESQVDTAVVEFLNYFFAQGFYRDAFLEVTLQTSLVTNGVAARRKTMRRHLTFQPTPHRQRRTTISTRTLAATAETVALDVNDGMATYNPNSPASDGKPAPVPTEEELSAILSAYFSLWGAEKLLEYFQNDGLPVNSVSQVVLNGDAIMMEEVDGQDGGDGDSGTNKVGVIAGSIAAAGALIVVAVILVNMKRRKKATQLEVDSREVGDINNHLSNQKEPAEMPVSWKNELNVSEIKVALPSPPPTDMPEPSSSAIPAEFQKKTTNPYAGSSAFALAMAPTRTTSEDDQDSVSESDGDIVSVTESLHHQHDREQLVATGGVNESSNVTDLLSLAMTGKASVRQQPPIAPQPNFQYDASRLDQVISDAKKQNLSEK